MRKKRPIFGRLELFLVCLVSSVLAGTAAFAAGAAHQPIRVEPSEMKSLSIVRLVLKPNYTSDVAVASDGLLAALAKDTKELGYKIVGASDESVFSKKDPNKAEIWNNYGVVLGFLGRFKSGLSAFDKAVLLSPDYGYAYFNKARMYVQIGEDEKALGQLKIAIQKDEALYEKAKEDLTLRKLKDTTEFRELAPKKKRIRKE